jgi:predicted NBD/HSP70 family sugar kinase
MFLLIDIGGTKMRLACSADGKQFGRLKIIPTPAKFSEAVSAIAKTAKELTDEPIQTVAVGLPGPLDAAKTKTVGSHKLPDWQHKPFKAAVERALGASVHIENDTALVGLGEAAIGAGQGFTIVAYVTVSTGVGGVRIVNKHIDKHATGFEPGFQIIDIDGSLYPESPAPHRLEHLLGGAQLQKRFGKKPPDITDPATWNQLAKWLAVGLNNTLVYWSPDIIILGGSLMNKIPIEIVRQTTRRLASFLPTIPPIEPASLGTVGGLHGALIFLQHQHTQDK